MILDDMLSSQVSIFAVHAQPNELRTRMQMCEVVNRKKLRHAHMVNIEKKIMLEGMRADFAKVDELTLRVMNIVNKAKRYPGRDSRGHGNQCRTDSRVQMDQDQRDHQPRQMGKPARRRNIYFAFGSEWDVCRGWRGGRLSVREIRRS